ncbi:thermonuclease family protein [Sphingomonas yabuuchiae]|nr:thermonuclease family protein [Sphingomonas yabuuchiae]
MVLIGTVSLGTLIGVSVPQGVGGGPAETSIAPHGPSRSPPPVEADPAAPMAMVGEATSDGAKFTICHVGGGTNCVVDGDTAWIDGEKVRIADIDAPETHPPRCGSEAELGDRATRRLAELMNAGPFELRRSDRDVDFYGRRLRVLVRDGRSLGDQLVGEGLARPWEGRRRPWC